MYLGGNAIQECIAFLGVEDPNGLGTGGIRPEGTGFLLNYHGFGYVVTARHVARSLQHQPLCIRTNRAGGGVNFDIREDVSWYFHPDETVDLAVLEYNPIGQERSQKRYVSWDLILTNDRMRSLDIQPGCLCYIVGLFKFAPGVNKNLSLVYAGNVARLDLDEGLPVYDRHDKVTRLCEVYLVESQGFQGLSGAPAFVRQTRSITYQAKEGPQTVLVPSNNIDLLGVFTGAWFLPPDATTRQAYETKSNAVPLGIGMVVPAQKIVDMLEVEELRERRRQAAL